MILVLLVPAEEQLAGKGSAGVSLPDQTVSHLLFRAGDRRGAAAGDGVAVILSASPQILLNEIRPLERPSPPLHTSDRRALVLLHGGAGTRVGLRRRAVSRASFCTETGKTGKDEAVYRQCRRGNRAAHPASVSRAMPGSERPTAARPGGAAAGVGPEPRPARLLQLLPRPRSSSQPGCFV